MREDVFAVELLRHRFRNGERAMPMRHSARDALHRRMSVGPDVEWVDDVLIVISELVQNVSEHTTGPGELVVSLELGAVLVEVGDASTVAPNLHDPATDHAGGRGLLLLGRISRRWGVRFCPTGKTVWAELAAGVDSRHLTVA
ncbi:ATP-binding protein [Actinoplanes couchii]|uniref:Histidine kinase/HSP90-like ATPase domain-containing protein n=1 Tax=Actinoplanes couchii TaxID=403638 RepID=A0ABQ3XU94_9ACTN|nr:hypothetical protein [Actinoplanes couchii]MDR6318980.1 anti-sigma regulatory factor (Ser/Thr protein kinase) [Actinoplanes couchii]GID62074.1 hypothetical protein Aco03nite_104780 [Actinoplanes couchii]